MMASILRTILLGGILLGTWFGGSFPALASYYRYHMPPPDHPLSILDQQYANLLNTTEDQRTVILDYAQEIKKYLAQQGIEAELVDQDLPPTQIYLEIVSDAFNGLTSQVADAGFKLALSPWRNLVHKIYNCKCQYVDLAQQSFFIGTWFLAEPDFYAPQTQHNLNLIKQFQQKVPLFLDASYLLTAGIGDFPLNPYAKNYFSHARDVLDIKKRIFVPSSLRKKTDFASYLGQTFNLYQALQEVWNTVGSPRPYRHTVSHLLRSFYKLSFEVSNRLAEIDLIIYHLTEENLPVNFVAHERCLEIVVAPLSYAANFYYVLYLPLPDHRIPTSKKEILQVKALQDLYFYLHDLQKDLRQIRPRLKNLVAGDSRELPKIRLQVINLLDLANKQPLQPPLNNFTETWSKKLGSTQNSIRRSLNDAIDFFEERRNCGINLVVPHAPTAVTVAPRPLLPGQAQKVNPYPAKNKNNGKYFSTKELSLNQVAKGFSPAASTPAAQDPSIINSLKNTWQNWWKKK